MAEEQELKRIADALEKMTRVYDDPAAWMEQVSRNFRQILQGVQVPLPAAIVQALPGGSQTVGIEVRLTSEQRDEICRKAMGDIEEQMTEFKGFISQSLSELPEHQLKKIGEHLAKGEKFKLRRRGGCIHLDFGYADEEFYLRM